MRRILDRTIIMFRLSGYIYTILLLVSLTCSAREESSESSNEQPTLIQIRVVSQLHNYPKSWSKAYLSSQDEFYYFSKAIEKCLKKIDGDYVFEFKHFPDKLDKGVFGVSIYLHDWRTSVGGMIETYFTVRYEYGEEKEALGSFRGQSFVALNPISSMRDRSFEDAVVSAGKEFVKKLQPILDQHFGEEDEGEE